MWIREGMGQACKDMYRFTEQSGCDLAAEYLLTIRVAEAIAKRSKLPRKVHIEMRTKKFATQCFPLLKHLPSGDRLRPVTIFQRRRDISHRPGRIDVAVMTDGVGDEQPVCAIEVKRLNPSDKLVRQDLERNAAYFALRDQIGERPLLEFTAFAALHRYRSGYRTEDIQKARELYERRTRKITLPEGVTSRVEVFSVDELRKAICDFEVGEVNLDAFLLMGIIVVFHWAEHSDPAPPDSPRTSTPTVG